MQEQVGFLKWFTSISENKRNIAIIVILCYLIYGFINKNDRDCFGDKLRITSERDFFQKKLEEEREKHDSDNKRHLLYVEKQAKKLEELRDRTEQLEMQKK